MGTFEVRRRLEEGDVIEVKRKTDSKGGIDIKFNISWISNM